MVLYQDLSVSAGGATGGLYLSAVSGRIRKLSVLRFERRIPHPLIILILSAKNIRGETGLYHRADRPSDPQVSTERPSSFSFACKAVGPCTGMSADLQTRDGVHTRRSTPWHQLLRAASVARAARPAAWSFRRVDAKVGPAISPVMCAGTAYQTPSSVVSVGASESPRCAPLPHRCRAAAAEAKNGPSVRAFERG